MAISLGVHVGQQNLTMDALRTLWRTLDEGGVDWISAWDHLYEAPPRDGSEPHFEAVATLAALAAETKNLSLIHISEPTRPERISYAVFCLKKKEKL